MFLQIVDVLRGETIRESLGLPQLADENEQGLAIQEIIQASGLEEQAFREIYLSWVDGTSINVLLVSQARS